VKAFDVCAFSMYKTPMTRCWAARARLRIRLVQDLKRMNDDLTASQRAIETANRNLENKIAERTSSSLSGNKREDFEPIWGEGVRRLRILHVQDADDSLLTSRG
jgi:hypothetical protein